MPRVAVVVDSQNVSHAARATLGAKGRPTVDGVRRALAPAGYQADEVHVGLALARPSDQPALARQHASNLAYSKAVEADGGDLLLGELHLKPSGQVQEKMVDGLCNVRIAKLAEQIRRGDVPLDGIVVLSQDIDLTPGVDHAVELGVPVVVAAHAVVQHRHHPHLLLGPWGYERLLGGSGDGYERRRAAVAAVLTAAPVRYEVVKAEHGDPRLRGPAGEAADPAAGVRLPSPGTAVELVPVGAYVSQKQHHPVLVCAQAPAPGRAVAAAVVRRLGTGWLLVDCAGQQRKVRYPLGGVLPGETVLVDLGGAQPCAIGPCGPPPARPFDADQPRLVEVLKPLSGKAVLVRDGSGRRGLATVAAPVSPGDRLPALQIDAKPQGPVWLAVGSPCPR